MKIRNIASFLFINVLAALFISACSKTINPVVPNAHFSNPTVTATSTGLTTPYPTTSITPTITVTPVMVTTVAGTGSVGDTNGTRTAASFNQPSGIAVDASGNLYVAEECGDLIREITADYAVSTLAGGGAGIAANGQGTAASFHGPFGIAVDHSGNVYVADIFNNQIRKITSAGMVSTLAGSGTPGSTDAIGPAASFNYPWGVAVDGAGNVYVADCYNNMIRKITPGGVVTTLAGGSGPGYGGSGSANGTGTAASFWYPTGIAVDLSGNLYVADQQNNMIRKITSGGVVTTLAGSGSPGDANGSGASASFYLPTGIAVDASGNVYVADEANNMIRFITPGGEVSTLVGSGAAGAANGPGNIASFHVPTGVAVDASGNVYVTDQNNQLIRKITP